MGIFDYVNFEMDCPQCGEPLKDFQTKDGNCYLNRVEFWEVDHFYDNCESCDTWVEFNRKKPMAPQPIEDYEMTVKLTERTPNE